MNINWTTIIISLVLATGLYLIPSPLQHSVDMSAYVPKDSIKIVHVTVHDSIPYPVSENIDSSKAQQSDSTKLISNLNVPHYFEKSVEGKTKDGTEFAIRSTTYPVLKNDSLQAIISLEYNIKPRPLQTTTETDTIYYTRLVRVPISKPIPFLEKPAVVATLTAVAAFFLTKAILKK